MLDRIFRKLKPKLIFPIAALLYGTFRVAVAYMESMKSGNEMSGAHLAGYALGALLVWGFVGLLLGFGFDWLDKREARKAADAAD